MEVPPGAGAHPGAAGLAEVGKPKNSSAFSSNTHRIFFEERVILC